MKGSEKMNDSLKDNHKNADSIEYNNQSDYAEYISKKTISDVEIFLNEVLPKEYFDEYDIQVEMRDITIFDL
jgi:hypothetical protein